MPTKRFPIQGESRPMGTGVRRESLPALNIPWEVAEIAYTQYIRTYGRHQSLARIAERGGFGRDELLNLLDKAQRKPGSG